MGNCVKRPILATMWSSLFEMVESGSTLESVFKSLPFLSSLASSGVADRISIKRSVRMSAIFKGVRNCSVLMLVTDLLGATCELSFLFFNIQF